MNDLRVKWVPQATYTIQTSKTDVSREAKHTPNTQSDSTYMWFKIGPNWVTLFRDEKQASKTVTNKGSGRHTSMVG